MIRRYDDQATDDISDESEKKILFVEKSLQPVFQVKALLRRPKKMVN